VETLKKMKTKIKILFALTSIALVLSASMAKSQTSSPVHFGIKAGGNFSNISLSDHGISSKYAFGSHAGLMTRIDLASIYLQGEVLYASKHSKVSTGNQPGKDVKWNSIEVPVLVGFKLLKSEGFNLRIFGGGVYSYVINDKTSVLNQVKQSFEKFDKSNIGYQLGGGVDLGRLSFDLRYEGALSNISKEFKSRPNSIAASIGFMIF
jgi:opacity protein-like surface antigen